MDNLYDVPFVIFNDGRILYQFKKREIFETSFGELKRLVYKNNKSSVCVEIQFDEDDKKSNSKNTNLFIERVNNVNKQLSLYYGVSYLPVLCKEQNVSIQCFLSLERNDFACVICNNWNVLTKLSDFEIQCRAVETLKTQKMLIRSVVELFGVLYDNTQNKYQMVILCKRMQYFDIHCRTFPKCLLNVEELVDKNEILQKELHELKKNEEYLRQENLKLRMEIKSHKSQCSSSSSSSSSSSISQDIPQENSCSNEQNLSKNHPKYGKYLKMIEKRVPMPAVRQKCTMENAAILTSDQIEALLEINPQSRYNLDTHPTFFVDSFLDNPDMSTACLTSSQLGSFQLKKVNIDEEEVVRMQMEQSSKNANGISITVDQLTEQMSKLKKTFFDFFS